MPVYFERFHSPFLSEAWAGERWRAAASISATASSAAETMLEVGALTTITPAWVAAFTSTLSRPTPARAITLRRRAAASASASTLVAERTRIASTSTMASSSSARSEPSQVRISKSGPSASTVAGLSSSAMSTTGRVLVGGAVTANLCLESQGSREEIGRTERGRTAVGTTLCPHNPTRAGAPSRTRLARKARDPRHLSFATAADE